MKKFSMVLSGLLLIFYAFCFTGCSKANKHQVSYDVGQEINVLYNDEENVSTVQVFFRISNGASRELESVNVQCVFTDGANNVIDTKQSTFTLRIEENTTRNYTLAFNDVQGKPTKVHITHFSPQFKENWFYNVIDWLAEYWWIIAIAVAVIVGGIIVIKEWI